MDNFLSKLKINPAASFSTERYTGQDILLKLDATGDDTFLCVVNGKGEDITPDYRYYAGSVAQLLRSMDNARREQVHQFSWDGVDEGISLKTHPYLLFPLALCKNIVDENMNPIHVSENNASLQLSLRREGDTIIPDLQANVGDGSIQKEFRLLSDSFLLADHTLYPTSPVGDNYTQLPFFIEPFREDLLESYLSIFCSFIENVQPVSEDFEVVVSPDEKVRTSPAILFEQVDDDNALYLKVIESIPGLPVDLTSQFELTRTATRTLDRQVLVRPLEHVSLEESLARVKKQIIQSTSDKQARKDVYQDGNLFIIPGDTAAHFLRQGLLSLLKDFQLIGTDKLRKYNLQLVRPRLNLQLSSGIDFLEGDADVEVGEEHFSLQEFLAQYRKQHYILLSDGSHALMDENYMRRLERLFRLKKKDKEVKVSFFDLPEIEEMLDSQLTGEVFKHHREVYEGFNLLKKQKLRLPALNATLRPYQIEGVKWIKYLHDNKLGGCLADDMGLGKTLQAITILTMLYPKEKTPSLVVMPRSLLFNWQDELNKFAPSLSVYTYYGHGRNLKEALSHQVVLTTYAMVRNDAEAFSREQFYYVILDESQNIKTINAQTTQAVFLLKARHRLALSGTPVENNLTELYSLFRFLNPTMFGSLSDFNEQYTYPIQRENDKEALESLRRKIFPFLLRRLKRDVLKELPDRTEQTLYVEMEKAQADFYEQRRRYYYRQVKENIATEGIQKSQFIMFQALSELRRIASVPESLTDDKITSPKLNLLLETVCEAVTNRHKVVIFFNFIAGLELAGERLEKEGIDFASMTGSTHDRRSVVERFQNDPQCMVLLMTLKTGGVGLNLTAADTVFIFEPWWNKAAEEQAINRLHRYGQTAKVLSYSLITKGTIEEKILQLQQQKSALFNELIGSDSALSKHLTEEDINYILG